MDDGAPHSRLTIAVAIAAIVAALGLLVAGIVLAPSGDDAADEAEASLAASSESEASHVEATAAPAPGAEAAGHGHDDSTPSASAAPSTATTVAHGHDEAVELAAGDSPATLTVPVVGHADHAPATTVPPVAGAPATTVPATHAHDSPTTVPAATPATTVVAAPAGPIISLDDPRLTAAQRDAAQTLLDRTVAGMAGFPDEQAVIDAGYVSIGDGITGFEHYVHVGYLTDGRVLDPNRIESIVLRVAGGTKTVESAMYILESGSTMADVPDIAGELTTWHDHQNLCWEGVRVVAVTRPDGSCLRGEFRPTAPMLHVWLTPQPCGPFAGIEGTHGDTCSSHGH